MRFIKLTNKINEPVFVNVDNILTFDRYDENTTNMRIIVTGKQIGRAHV